MTALIVQSFRFYFSYYIDITYIMIQKIILLMLRAPHQLKVK